MNKVPVIAAGMLGVYLDNSKISMFEHIRLEHESQLSSCHPNIIQEVIHINGNWGRNQQTGQTCVISLIPFRVLKCTVVGVKLAGRNDRFPVNNKYHFHRTDGSS